jgi:hypothetical protein
MLDTDTFITSVYVLVDDFCKEHLPESVHRGPVAGLSQSEIVTLAIIGQWGRWQSERDFYRFAEQQLRSVFPRLPHRTRYNRLARRYRESIVQVALHVHAMLSSEADAIEIIDGTAVVVRDVHRRGYSWLSGESDIGYGTRIGWYYGFRLLIAVTAVGVISGYCFAPASQNDRRLAEALFALRALRSQRVPSIGRYFTGVYLADKGFAGDKWLPQWHQLYHARVIAQGQREKWSAATCRWLAHHRQIVETIFAKLHNSFGLKSERPHSLDGFQMRLAAKVALHNICIWINRSIDRPALATADLLDWY